MFKRLFCIFTMLLIPYSLIGCNNQTKQKPIEWEEIDVNSMTAYGWPLGEYDITNTDEIITIMDCIQKIDFTNKIKSFDGNDLTLNGGPQTLKINHSNGTIKIIMYNEQVIIEDSQVDYKRYCEITYYELRAICDTVVQYRPKDE